MAVVPFLTLPALQTPGIGHGFFTCAGGVSSGIHASLNCGFGAADPREHVVENRARAVAALGFAPEALATPHQVHSPRAVIVERAWAAGEAPHADAVVTARSGVCVGVLSADCVPILLVDGTARVVAAAHAGWKGARGGVLEAAVEAMVGLGARVDRIAAGIGPAIRQESYEVGPEFPDHFPDAPQLFRPAVRAGHWMFDLPGYVALRLARLGLASVSDLGLDTVGDADRFFSYRRGVLNGTTQYGRLLSAIGIA